MGLEDSLRARAADAERHPERGRLRGMGSAPRPLPAGALRSAAPERQGAAQGRCSSSAWPRRPGPTSRWRGSSAGWPRRRASSCMFEALPRILASRPMNFVALGSGEARYEDFFSALARSFPARVHFHRGYDDELAHWIEAASDLFLMPSLYEPCGLNQMYSLRYGTVPIVRRTGGLADSVEHFDPRVGHRHRRRVQRLRHAGARVGAEHGARPVCAAAAVGAPGAQRHGAGFLLAAPGRAVPASCTAGALTGSLKLPR